MKGKVDVNGLRFDWELTPTRQPKHSKLRVHFDEWGVECEYAIPLSRRTAEKEAARLVPELLKSPAGAIDGNDHRPHEPKA